MVKKTGYSKDSILILFDRDGVLSNNPVNGVLKLSQFKTVPNLVKILNSLKGRNFKIGIITNQRYIASGELSIKELNKMNLLLKNKFIEAGLSARDIKIKVCPHSKDAHCKCRKPNIKLIEEVVAEFKLNPKNTRFYMVGDKPSDAQTLVNYYDSILKKLGVNKTKIKTVLLEWKLGEQNPKYFKNHQTVNYISNSLADSVKFILKSEKEIG